MRGLKIPRGNKWERLHTTMFDNKFVEHTAMFDNKCVRHTTMFAHKHTWRMRQYGSRHPAVLSAKEGIGGEQESINRVLAAV